MATQTQLSPFSNTNSIYLSGQETPKKNYLGREIVPAAHNGVAGGSSSLISILLIVGAVLWGVGVSQGNPSMILAGQVLVGIELGLIVLGLLGVACICACTACES